MKSLFLVNLAALLAVCTDISVAQSSRGTAYDRVMSTGELRCGYALWPNLVEKDPNTGKLSGAFYEYVEALGKAAELKITWAEEVNFADLVEVLRSNRVDAICSGAWTNAIRGKFTDFTTPIAFQAISAFARSDDTRFDDHLDRINSPLVSISVIDGESAASVANTDFPLAKIVSLPKGTDVSQMLLNVATKKADVTFTDMGSATQFLTNNPGKLRAVPAANPPRVFGLPIVLKKGEYELKETLNVATNQLLWTGQIERILQKYEKVPGIFLRVHQPYAMQR